MIVADTGGSPAVARTKAQELVERDGVDAIIGQGIVALGPSGVHKYVLRPSITH